VLRPSHSEKKRYLLIQDELMSQSKEILKNHFETVMESIVDDAKESKDEWAGIMKSYLNLYDQLVVELSDKPVGVITDRLNTLRKVMELEAVNHAVSTSTRTRNKLIQHMGYVLKGLLLAAVAV